MTSPWRWTSCSTSRICPDMPAVNFSTLCTSCSTSHSCPAIEAPICSTLCTASSSKSNLWLKASETSYVVFAVRACMSPRASNASSFDWRARTLPSTGSREAIRRSITCVWICSVNRDMTLLMLSSLSAFLSCTLPSWIPCSSALKRLLIVSLNILMRLSNVDCFSAKRRSESMMRSSIHCTGVCSPPSLCAFGWATKRFIFAADMGRSGSPCQDHMRSRAMLFAPVACALRRQTAAGLSHSP
mmetsp:Transcript_34959/g.100678  ORF Transcript_34959/g.100678 Transcript_34959/m.100678 type:complete len:243 (+) Transcript_34959:815-1543(+)